MNTVLARLMRRGLRLTPRPSACPRPLASPREPEANPIVTPLQVMDSSPRLHTSAWGRKEVPARSPEPTHPKKDPGEREWALVTSEDLFARAGAGSRNRATFERVLGAFRGRDIRRRGHVEFIYTALRKMPEFGVERELEVYNRLLDVFPKEVFVPRSYIQRMFNHFPRQQECAIQILEQMENYGILPNTATKSLLVQIFGPKSHPMRKFQRLLYWFPRFKHVNPFPVPEPLSMDPLELARIGLERIAGDPSSEVTVYQIPHTERGPDGRAIHFPHVV
uniref:evolutionarily conserved signaling intermediate in Toll pathway, mitochondrial n=1 Tax=Pristiophorus japonicus TaxID=55135 RepID=UPI00398E3538